jgi:hypothetical protein
MKLIVIAAFAHVVPPRSTSVALTVVEEAVTVGVTATAFGIKGSFSVTACIEDSLETKNISNL